MLEVDFSSFPELLTERLVLRRLQSADAGQFLVLRSNPEVMKFIGKKPMESIEEAEIFVTVIDGLLKDNSGITWAISPREEPEQLIGTVGLWRLIREHYRAEIGYMLLPEYWRKGIAREAVLKVLEFGFKVLRLHSIEGRITPLNTASARVLESTGFKREAYFHEDFFFNGQFHDTAIYSLLESSFSGRFL